MWQPEPGWEALPGGSGALTVGQWRVRGEGSRAVVKRVRRPEPDEYEYLDPHGSAYWRRELEVALDHDGFRGLVLPEVIGVDEDDGGFTLWSAEVDGPGPTSLFVAAALARFASSPVPQAVDDDRGVLADRLRMMETRDGWPTLARTTFADLADELWRRRTAILRRYDELPPCAAHGDVAPRNLVGVLGEDVVAVDWASFGTAPAGADVGYFALSCREGFDAVIGAYLDALDVGESAAAGVRLAAQAMAVYTVVARAEWALARVAPGEGALAGKYRHPAVAPHLRALQRQFPQIESLLQG